MAIVHVNVDLSTLDVSGLLDYMDYTLATDGTSFRVFDDATHYVEFTGTGLSATVIGGTVVGVSGTITGLTSVDGNPQVPQLDVSGANVSASDLFSLAVTGDTIGALKLFLAGNDTIYGSGANDLLHGYAGNDKILGYGGADHLFGDFGSDTLIGGGGNDVLKGGAGGDVLKGGTGADHVFGQGGGDTMHGYGGNDVLYGANGNDFIHGEAGADKEFGGAGGDRLVGEGGNDTLLGGLGKDTIVGGIGKDLIKGQGGADVMTGNGGHDTFFFGALSDSKPGPGHDQIVDFQQGIDHIALFAIDADTSTAANDSFDLIGTSTFGGHAGELRYHILAGGHTIIYADVNGDKTPDLMIELDSTVHLHGSDFFGAS